jgi:PadR family transcriptional regulator PadR
VAKRGAGTSSDQLHGTLDMLVLKTLQHGPMHGYAIAVRLEQLSKEVLQVEEGSLYPALYRMEARGALSSEWGVTDTGRRARFYRLTKAGKAQLAEETQSWARITAAVQSVLES